MKPITHMLFKIDPDRTEFEKAIHELIWKEGVPLETIREISPWARHHVRIPWHATQVRPDVLDKMDVMQGHWSRVPHGPDLPVDWFFELEVDYNLLKQMEGVA